MRIILFLTSVFCFSQNYNKSFISAFKSGDVEGQERILKKWEKTNPDDPNLMMKQLSYYFSIAQKPALSSNSNSEESSSQASITSRGSQGSYRNLSTEVTIDPALIKEGVDCINRAIAIYPDRIDVRLAKVDAFAEILDWKSYGDAVVELIARSKKNNNQWIDENDEIIADAKNYFFITVQDCQVYLFEQEQNELICSEMRKIGKEMLKYYPDHVESMSNISISYINEKKFDEGLKYLKEAEVIAPQDSVILTNIAGVYLEKRDFKKAKEYYEKAYIYGDDKSKAYITEKLRKMTEKSNSSTYNVIGASFANKINAEKHAKNMIKKGYKAKVLAINSSGLYPVSYGQFDDEEKAKVFLEKIKKEQNISAYIN